MIHGYGIIAVRDKYGIRPFVYNKFYNSTLSLLTGFIIGSLLMIWPWVNTDSKIYLPIELSLDNITIILCIFIGVLSIYILEKVSTSHD